MPIHHNVVARKRVAGGGSFDYFDETFEAIGGDETWTEVTGTVDFNSTSAPIAGTYSALLDDLGTAVNDLSATTASTVTEGYFSAAFQVSVVGATGETTRFISFLDGSNNVIAEFRLFSSMTQIYTYYEDTGTTVGAPESYTLTGNEIVYLGVHYTAGASTAAYEFWVSATPLGSSWGAADQSYTGKASAAGIAKIRLLRDSNINEFKFDNITGASTQVAR